jgi:hypothetical protein
MRSLGEYVPERRLIETILRSVLSKFQMVTTSIMISRDLNTMIIGELSGFLLTVEENKPNGEVEHAFSTRHRGRGRGRNQYHNRNYNISPQQFFFIIKKMHLEEEEEVQVSLEEVQFNSKDEA